MLVTRHEVWIDNWIYGTLVTTNDYETNLQIHSLLSGILSLVIAR
jgi:hypothetical protein